MTSTTCGWELFKSFSIEIETLGITVDFSRAGLSEGFLDENDGCMQYCFDKLKELEDGAIANPDENRQAGHYWLRNPSLAPSAEISQQIEQAIQMVNSFAHRVLTGELVGERGRIIRHMLLIGIGGSSLGPRFLADALCAVDAPIRAHFVDNTDPDGIDRVLSTLDSELDRTLVVVVSKSGSTVETRNGMVEVQIAYEDAGLSFARHAVAITQEGSQLDVIRVRDGWVAAFPMWEWVGGRTSVLSAVGLLPLRLVGVDTDSLLLGAQVCDSATRVRNVKKNPAALMALAWFLHGEGKGGGQMVVLPYKDRLELFSKYLQQLIMESLGKELDLDGRTVHQGLTVFGNKGASDQHSYVQQLLDGPNNFIAAFVEVLTDRDMPSVLVDGANTSGDFLQAFLLGTRQALTERGRSSITITIDRVDALRLGALIALFERAVTLYAFLTNINAYHQPAVEMGKRSAGEIIALKNEIVNFLTDEQGASYTVEQIAHALRDKGKAADEETVFYLLRRLCMNTQYGIRSEKETSFAGRYWYVDE